MGAPPEAQALIDTAQNALRTLASAPLVARAARAARDELDTAWRRVPLTIGVGGGDLAGRTALLDLVCGGGVLDRRPRAPGSAAFRVRRGEVTRFTAVRVDGPGETHLLPVEGVDLSARQRVEGAAEVLQARQREAGDAEEVLPAVLRTRPPWWAFWRWPMRWLARLAARGRLAAKRRAADALEVARADLDRARHALAAREAPLSAARDRFFDRLGELGSGSAAGAGVREIDLEIGGDVVPEGVEALELNGWSHAAATVDAVVIVADGAVQAPGGRGGTTLRLGAPTEVVAGLPHLLAETRALRLARRTREHMVAGLRELELVLERAAVDFATRIARLEELRVTDRDGFIAAERQRMAPQISGTVTAVLEHASAYLDAELAGQLEAWRSNVARASTGDELKAAIATVDSGAAALVRIGEDVKRLVMGGLGGGTRDLHADLVAPLRARGLPDEHAATPRAAADVPAVPLLPSLTRPGSPRLADSEGWLTGLVRGLEHRRGEMNQKVAAYTARVVQLAHAEMLDAEPRLHAALGDALVQQLGAAVDLQVEALEAALAEERAVIDRERTALTSVAQQRAAVRRDLARLDAAIAEVEAAQPALALAAAATPAIGSAAT